MFVCLFNTESVKLSTTTTKVESKMWWDPKQSRDWIWADLCKFYKWEGYREQTKVLYVKLYEVQQGQALGPAPGTQQPEAALQAAEGRVAGKLPGGKDPWGTGQ